MKYCIFVIDLKTGDLVHKECDLSLGQALATYSILSKHYTNYCTGENYIVALYNREIGAATVKKDIVTKATGKTGREEE